MNEPISIKTYPEGYVNFLAARNGPLSQADTKLGWRLLVQDGRGQHTIFFYSMKEHQNDDSLSSSKRIRNFKVVQDHILDQLNVVLSDRVAPDGTLINDEHWQLLLSRLIREGNTLAAKAQERIHGRKPD
jgi:hypothetical protein